MITLYDGHSDIDWFYDGKMSFDEMKSYPKYKEVTKYPVVLRGNSQGKIYGYELAVDYAMRHGEFLNFDNPAETIDKINSKINGFYVDPVDVLSSILMRFNLSDSEARGYTQFYPSWGVGIDYKKDWIVEYEGNLYRVAQDHTSQEQWVPGSEGTESLYTNISVDESGYEIWKRPTGAHDAYNQGDIVKYNDSLYESLINGNAWSPVEYPPGWKLYDEATGSTDPEPGEGSGEETYPEFVQPTGSHDAYNKGDIVRYNGELYKSLIDGNVYSPDTYPDGWEKYTEPEA